MTTKAIFELEAAVRHDMGKGASRRLRRTQDRIPAIVYGGTESPLSISLDHKKMMHALENEAFYSHLLTLNIEGKKHTVVLKDLQRHHFKKGLHHADFLRVNATDQINMHVPLHFINEAKCPGVKSGGVISHRQIDVELQCRANNIPEYIEIDLSKLELDQSIHLSQLKLPKDVSIVALAHGHSEHDIAVVSVHLPRIAEEEPTVAPAAAETQVAPKGKEATGSLDKDKGSKSL